jgi:hypothetical protein
VDTADDVGRGASITVGEDGLGLISYYDATTHVLKVAHCTTADCSAVTSATIDSSADVGSYTSITIGPDGLGLIVYIDATNSQLRIAHCNDVACSSATTQALASNVAASPVSLATGADGLGIVAYRDTSLALKIAHLSNPLGIPYFRRR